MTFDDITDFRGTGCSKWDLTAQACGIEADNALPMWVADKDFAAPDFLNDAMRRLADVGHYGYFCGMDAYYESVMDWMETRHAWRPERQWMFTTAGLGNAIALTLLALTNPGDEIVTFNPVYHEFANKITGSGRVPKQLPLAIEEGVFKMDFGAYEEMMSGREAAVLVSSPHNPAGKVWSAEELNELGEFCERHDLLLIADEIHHDLIMPGFEFVATYPALPRFRDRLIIMTAASKTFSTAGLRTGCLMIPSDALRARFAAFFNTLDLSPNRAGIELTRAAYSPEGAKYADELMMYLDRNRRVFNDALNAIPGVSAMPMQSTYLAWINFENTGMDMAEIRTRVFDQAKIGATWGATLGPGGETCLRFNIATQKARIDDAVERLQTAFADLQ